MAKQTPLVLTPPKPYQNTKIYRLGLEDASASAFHTGIVTIAGLLMAGGVVSLVGIRNPAKQ